MIESIHSSDISHCLLQFPGGGGIHSPVNYVSKNSLGNGGIKISNKYK